MFYKQSCCIIRFWLIFLMEIAFVWTVWSFWQKWMKDRKDHTPNKQQTPTHKDQLGIPTARSASKQSWQFLALFANQSIPESTSYLFKNNYGSKRKIFSHWWHDDSWTALWRSNLGTVFSRAAISIRSLELEYTKKESVSICWWRMRFVKYWTNTTGCWYMHSTPSYLNK